MILTLIDKSYIMILKFLICLIVLLYMLGPDFFSILQNNFIKLNLNDSFKMENLLV